ncbi:autoinducer binding domain-containing protein [Bartonella choladocola]|uniref:autoinducer binding domain-containing protein n=1 Tax=Bartonella choladocola TaxID=2750995 RepID=UPI001662646B|nr:autoinducer binding domain-containing protein [Bartonella choladocola]
MTTDIFEQFDGAFRPGISIDEAFNTSKEFLEPLGYDSCAFTYVPHFKNFEGKILVPAYTNAVGAPSDFVDTWVNENYFDSDPVYELQMKRNGVFSWSYKDESSITPLLKDPKYARVVSYLNDTKFTLGISCTHNLFGQQSSFIWSAIVKFFGVPY